MVLNFYFVEKCRLRFRNVFYIEFNFEFFDQFMSVFVIENVFAWITIIFFRCFKVKKK